MRIAQNLAPVSLRQKAVGKAAYPRFFAVDVTVKQGFQIGSDAAYAYAVFDKENPFVLRGDRQKIFFIERL